MRSHDTLTFVRLSYGPLALRDFAYCRSDKSQSAPCHPPTQAAGVGAMLSPKIFISELSVARTMPRTDSELNAHALITNRPAHRYPNPIHAISNPPDRW